MSPQSHILSKFCKTLHKGSREGTTKFQPDWIEYKIQGRQSLADTLPQQDGLFKYAPVYEIVTRIGLTYQSSLQSMVEI